MSIFHDIFYQPIYNILIVLYHFLWNDFAIAIIVLTVLVKFALLPLSRKQINSQKKMQELQPKIKDLQEKHKGDKEVLAKKTMSLYKENDINPAAGCLPLIVMIVLFFAMYRVIFNLSGEQDFIPKAEDLYSFVPQIDRISEIGLGFLELGKVNIPLAIITAAMTYIQIAMMQKKNQESNNSLKKGEEEKQVKAVEKKGPKSLTDPDFAQTLQKQMLYIIPAMTLFIGFTFPAGLTLYWFTSTLFTVVQQWFVMKA
jgi:YidC/Oxa1 family membrane protein insertase